MSWKSQGGPGAMLCRSWNRDLRLTGKLWTLFCHAGRRCPGWFRIFCLFSSFRDYDTQLRIWNRKFACEKPLYDLDGKPRDFASLSERQKIECILNWSALPGGSRHQWGTEDPQTSSMPGRCRKDMPKAASRRNLRRRNFLAGLHRWLDENMANFAFPAHKFLQRRHVPGALAFKLCAFIAEGH